MNPVVYLIALIICLPLPVFAGEPMATPMLRLGTDMHFVKINRGDTDAASRLILTCSNDKTARLWDAQDGNLLKILRVPALGGNEGKLYACALSPDGRTAVVGGWTGWDFQGNHNIYFFDTFTGEMIQRIPGMDNVILDLEFHTDGTLAAALGRSNGIRIFRKSGGTYRLHAKDTNYGDSSNNVVFDAGGRLASASYDGYVRLYDKDFRLIRKKQTTGGNRPYSVAFSPDGRKLAVGYNDSGTVEVLDGSTLELLYRPDNQGADSRGQGINTLTFGKTGHLYGGGLYDKSVDGKNWWFIRRWSNEGRGAYTEFKAAGDAIMDIKTLADGSIVFAGAQPDFGRMTATGKQVFYKRGETLDFRDKDRFDYFTVNQDAGEISFKPLGGNPSTFSIPKRALTASETRFKAYRDHFGGTRVTQWKNSYSPRINGREAGFLEKYERCRSVDIGEDGTILAGADWSVYALDADGKQKWRAVVPGAAWAVKIAGNGRVAVAAHGGGEIRWYRMSDGAGLLSLYAHPDGKRWIMNTPQGYYDASPGADTLMGWHVNNGWNQAADFFPIGKFASKFYRPDVIARVIETADVEKAILLADRETRKKASTLSVNQMLPPVITILSPGDGATFSSNSLTVRYQVRTPSGEKVTQVKAFVDGRPVSKRGLFIKETDNGAETVVPVPDRNCEVSLVAENRFAASTPAVVRLTWKGAAEFSVKPKLYVLAIGVSAYQDPNLTLGYAAKDAGDIVRALEKQTGGLYREVKAKLIVDNEATRGNILDGFDWILHQTTQKDVAMVFLAGHGVNDDYGKYYYLPQNAEIQKIRRTCVPYGDIKETVANIAGKALFFIDTCHSGNVLGSKRRAANDTAGIINELASAENGVVVFASSTGTQYSLEDKSWGNGAFTKAIVEGVSGKAAYKGDKITVNMLDLYISERVKELTSGRQTPTTAKPSTIPDFPIAVKH